MSFQIQYIYNLVDKVSPSLRKIQRNVKDTERKIASTANRASRSFAKIGRAARNLSNKAIAPLKSRMAGLVATLGSFVGIQKAISVLSEFESGMAKVQAVTRASSKDMNRMIELSKKLGMTTEFSAGQAASGMSFLGLAGFNASEILKSMSGVIDLATAGSLDLAEAADISSNILTGFGLKAQEINKVVDVMAEVNASANTNIRQLGEAMKFVAPVSEISKVSIEKTAAAIGVLSDSGLQASMAGTGLRRIISELANPSREAQKVMGRLGLTQKDIDIKSQGLVKVLKKLAPLAEDTGSAFKVFGDRGAPAFAVLSKNLPRLEELIKKLDNSSGAGSRLATVMRDQLGGDIKGLFSSIEGLVLKLGEQGLTAALKGIIKGMTVFFRALAGNKEALGNLSLAAQGLVDVLKVLGYLVKFLFQAISVGFKIANVSISVFLETVNALYDGFMILIEPLLKINDLVTKAFGGMAKLFSSENNIKQELDINKNIVSKNIVNNAQAQKQQVSVGGNVGIDIRGLPKGSSANFTPAPNNNIDLGFNSIFSPA